MIKHRRVDSSLTSLSKTVRSDAAAFNKFYCSNFRLKRLTYGQTVGRMKFSVERGGIGRTKNYLLNFFIGDVRLVSCEFESQFNHAWHHNIFFRII